MRACTGETQDACGSHHRNDEAQAGSHVGSAIQPLKIAAESWQLIRHPEAKKKAMTGARDPERRRALEAGSTWRLERHGGRNGVRGVAQPALVPRAQPAVELHSRAEIFDADPAGPRAGFQSERSREADGIAELPG